jgi:hypothetical protein
VGGTTASGRTGTARDVDGAPVYGATSVATGASPEAAGGMNSPRTVLFAGGGGGDGTRTFWPQRGQRTFTPASWADDSSTALQFGQK